MTARQPTSPAIPAAAPRAPSAAIIEWPVPFSALKMGEGGEFQLQMHWSFNGQPFQAIPAREPLTIRVPGARDYAAYLASVELKPVLGVRSRVQG